MITIKVDKPTLDSIEKEYNDFIINRNIGYILFVIKTNEHIITAYNNAKGHNFKVTIQGGDYLSLAKKYCNDPILIPKKAKNIKESLEFIDVDSQIGSDEVGTGDFFGPIVVCAAYSDHETMKLISQYGITDSKKLTDKKILEIVPLILKKVHYDVKILTNQKYNDAFKKGFNLNKIKAILHNFLLTKLHERCPYVTNIYVDKFCSEENYYSYLKGIENITKDIIFKEKGETYFPSIALASCIARYYFLKEIESLENKLQTKIPLGAGLEVDAFAKKYLETHNIEDLKKLVKANFRNFKDLENIKLF